MLDALLASLDPLTAAPFAAATRGDPVRPAYVHLAGHLRAMAFHGALDGVRDPSWAGDLALDREALVWSYRRARELVRAGGERMVAPTADAAWVQMLSHELLDEASLRERLGLPGAWMLGPDLRLLPPRPRSRLMATVLAQPHDTHPFVGLLAALGPVA